MRLPPRPPHGPRSPLRNRCVSRAARPARSRFRRRRRVSQRRLRRSAVWGPNPATGSGRARPKPRRDTAPCLWDARGRPGCANARRGRALRCRHGVERVPGLPEPQVRARIAPPQRLRRLGRVLKVHLSAQVALASGGRRGGGVVWFDRAGRRVLAFRPVCQRQGVHRGHQAGRCGTRQVCARSESMLHRVGPWGARVVGGRRSGWCVHGGDGSYSVLAALLYVHKKEPSNDCTRKGQLGEQRRSCPRVGSAINSWLLR